MDIQFMIVAVVILAALAYGGVTFARRTRAFSPKKSCGSDCGCGSSKQSRRAV
jgi:hypothetical protein